MRYGDVEWTLEMVYKWLSVGLPEGLGFGPSKRNGVTVSSSE